MSKLLPCPFCGYENIICFDAHSSYHYKVMCNFCSASVTHSYRRHPDHFHKSDHLLNRSAQIAVVKKWNKRVD